MLINSCQNFQALISAHLPLSWKAGNTTELANAQAMVTTHRYLYKLYKYKLQLFHVTAHIQKIHCLLYSITITYYNTRLAAESALVKQLT